MDGSDYWSRLEHRVCRELLGLADEQLRCLWCDGFVPEGFESGSTGAVITGRAWIGRGGREQEKWGFRLLVGRTVRRRDEIDWAELLPADDVTGWLSVDAEARLLKMKPCAAHPGRDAIR